MEPKIADDWASIARITVERLFGRYDYDIPSRPDGFDPKLFILYGDNGSGKTTILHILHHLLSPDIRRAHKSAVARVPFRSFSIDFSNGSNLTATRRPVPLSSGSFTLHLTNNGRKVSERYFKTSEKGHVAPADTPEGIQAEEAFAQACSEFIGMESYLLTDDRQFDSDSIPEKRDESARQLDMEEYDVDLHIPPQEIENRVRAPRIGFDPAAGDLLLLRALDRFDSWARRQAVEGVSAGSVNTNAVYSELLDRLAQSRYSKEHEPKQRIAELEHRIRYLAEMSERQAAYGFDAQFPAAKFLDQLRNVPRSSLELAAVAFEPYLDGVEARLRTQENTVQAIGLFIDTLNEYLRDKYLSFNVESGLKVHASRRRFVAAQRLSSGERQLLTLFCNIMAARTRSSVFIIDEPEISLNIKWQRRLVDSLLGCTANSGVQLAMASHSFELLSKHRECVSQLMMEQGGNV